jgi:hypothetical protein
VTLAPDFAFAHPGYGERIRFSNNQLHLHTSAFPRRESPELCLYASPREAWRYPKEGAGNAGCPLHP